MILYGILPALYLVYHKTFCYDRYMNMVQRKFYFPIEMYNRLQQLARVQKQSITETVRELISEGLERKRQQGKGNGAAVLLELARMAEREGWHGPPAG